MAAGLVPANRNAGAIFTVFTYIAPILHEQTRADVGFVTAMLVTYGLGLTARNWLGASSRTGRSTERSSSPWPR